MQQVDPIQFEEKNGIQFKDKGLLKQAFIHRSYMNEVEADGDLGDNERLEFLGDSIISFLVSELLYGRFPDYREGDLTGTRSALVRRETLAALARELNMGDYLLLGHGEEESGGRTRPVTLCATFEAVIGALYEDQGLTSVRKFLLPYVERELERVTQSDLSKDAKSRLQEWSQRELGYTPRYKMTERDGPDHARIFTMQATINKIAVGVGKGRSKQEAEQIAAAMALYRLGQEAPEFEPDDELTARHPLPDVDWDALRASE